MKRTERVEGILREIFPDSDVSTDTFSKQMRSRHVTTVKLKELKSDIVSAFGGNIMLLHPHKKERVALMDNAIVGLRPNTNSILVHMYDIDRPDGSLLKVLILEVNEKRHVMIGFNAYRLAVSPDEWAALKDVQQQVEKKVKEMR